MFSKRPATSTYVNPRVNHLVEELVASQRESMGEQQKKVKEKRKLYHSLSVSHRKKQQFEHRPQFNNKTKQGELLDSHVKNIPYRFIPGYKNNTFIMPDRIFQKGKAAKRFYVKMKDTSVYSFRQQQDKQTNKILNKTQKQKTIISRQVEQYDRIVNTADGVRKCQNNKWFLRNRKTFNPTNTFGLFSQCSPMLQPKQFQNKHIKKVSLAKCHDNSKKWRPVTRGTQSFNASAINSFYSASQYPASVL